MFPPSGDGLLRRLGGLVKDEMLEEISRAGRCGGGASLRALLVVRDEGFVRTPLGWALREVLELMRWSEPGDYTRRPDGGRVRGHLMRAFCCAALLGVVIEPTEFGLSNRENETLIQLIDSALYLHAGVPEAVGSFLCWSLARLRSDHRERPFFAFGLVALALLDGRGALAASDVDSLVDFVERAEAEVRDPLGVCTLEMFAGSFLEETPYDGRLFAWRALAARVVLCVPDSLRLANLVGRMNSI